VTASYKRASMSALVQLRRPGRPPSAQSSSDGPGASDGAGDGDGHRVYVETYGCQMNVADTDLMLGLLGGAGYTRTADPAQADLILINTCAVREKAEERVWGRAGVLSQHRARRGAVLGITGCMAEHLKGRIAERAPYVDLVVGPDGYRRLVEHVAAARAGARVEDTVLDRDETYAGLDPVAHHGNSTSNGDAAGVVGRVTIQRGCDKFCTFCVVPYTRGRERGTAPREVLRQVRALGAAGYKEVQLLGQTVNSYRHEEAGFADLLRAVADVDGIERVRFTSPYPVDFSSQVIAAIAELPKVCKHVHLPLQTASEPVLARMRRGYSYAQFRELARELRARIPGIAITTDILVGFCDETEEEFQATLAAQEELRFDAAFMFAYSEREGTYAARKMPDTVPADVKSRRLAEVIAVQRRITGEILRAQIGRTERVLVEALSKRSRDAATQEYLARTDTFRSVILPAASGVHPGALGDVVIEAATTATLKGRWSATAA
jgi:tRNA-2-methylthio-N6-dimethylallyladenosine synthase